MSQRAGKDPKRRARAPGEALGASQLHQLGPRICTASGRRLQPDPTPARPRGRGAHAPPVTWGIEAASRVEARHPSQDCGMGPALCSARTRVLHVDVARGLRRAGRQPAGRLGGGWGALRSWGPGADGRVPSRAAVEGDRLLRARRGQEDDQHQASAQVPFSAAPRAQHSPGSCPPPQHPSTPGTMSE